MLKTKTWIIIISFVFAVSLACSLVISRRPADTSLVEVVQDGQVIRELDLAAVESEYSFVVESENGTNTVTVQPGRICISEADCPDRTCVSQGWLKNSSMPIICMPHRLIIRRAEKGSDYDAIAQ